MNSPNNLVLKRYVQIIFYLSFFLFTYFYIKYSSHYSLTKYCFLNCLMTGTSFLVRDSRWYKEKKHL